MATSLSEFKDLSGIAKEIVGSSSDSESCDNEINECDSLFSDSKSGKNEITNEHGNETTSKLSSPLRATPESTTIPSLLDVLRTPKLSEISRRKKTYNNTCGGKRRKARSSSSSASEPKTYQPEQQLKQYPNEPFDIFSRQVVLQGMLRGIKP